MYWLPSLISVPFISYYVFLQAEEPDRTKQQRMMFGNPYRQEKTDGGADEGWSEGTGGLHQRGRKRRRHIQQQGDFSSSVSTSLSCSKLSCLAESSTDIVSLNTEMMSSQRLLKGQDNLHTSSLVEKSCQSVPASILKEGDLIITLSELDCPADKCILARGIDHAVTDEEYRISVTDNLDPRNCGGPEREVQIGIQGQRERKSNVVLVRPLVSHVDQSHVVTILLSVIRALRYSKSLITKQVSITFFSKKG